MIETKSKIAEQLAETTQRLDAILGRKSQDYSGNRGEFWAIQQSSELSGVPVQQTILVRMSDKICRISTLLQSNEVSMVANESIDDTLLDLVGYAVILMAYRSEREVNEVAGQAAPYSTVNVKGYPDVLSLYGSGMQSKGLK